jgi:hypothetical protein
MTIHQQKRPVDVDCQISTEIGLTVDPSRYISTLSRFVVIRWRSLTKDTEIMQVLR